MDLTRSPATADDSVQLQEWAEHVRSRTQARRTQRLAHTPRALRIGTLAFIFVVHGLIVLGARYVAPRHDSDHTAVVMRLLDAPAPEVPLPQPAPLPRKAFDARTREATAGVPTAAAAEATAQPSSPPIHIYNTDGSIDLRAAPAPVAAPRALAAVPLDSSGFMRHQRPLKVRPNRFASTWYTPSGSPLMDFVDRNLTVQRTFRTPWGSKIVCKGVTVFVAVIGGCAFGFPPPHWEPPQPWQPASALDEQ